MNKVIITGRFVRDPELRATSSGSSVCNFTLAVDRPRRKDGTKETDFLDCVCFGKQGENVAFYKHKGEQAAVEGRVQKRSYEGKDGRTVYVTEIVAERVEFMSDGKRGEPNVAETQTTINGFESVDEDVPW